MAVMVVALDDCTRRVAIAPQKAPRIGVSAAFARTVRSAEPASAFKPSVMTVMPRRNKPTPPRMEIAVDICPPNPNLSVVRTSPKPWRLLTAGGRLFMTRAPVPRAQWPILLSFWHRLLETRGRALRRRLRWLQQQEVE